MTDQRDAVLSEAMNTALKGLYQAWRDLPVDLLIKGQSRSDCLVRELFSHVKEVIIQYQRADLSPPVPDDVAEAIEHLRDGMKRAKEQNWEASVLRHKDVETIIRAASTPSADVRAVSEVTVEWLVEMDYMTKYNAEQLALAKPNGIKIIGDK